MTRTPAFPLAPPLFRFVVGNMWLFAGDAELADAAAAGAAGGTDDLGGALGLDDPSAVAAGAGAIIGDAGAAAAGAIIGALANGTSAAAGLGLLGAANATGAGAAAAGALGAAPTCAPSRRGSRRSTCSAS